MALRRWRKWRGLRCGNSWLGREDDDAEGIAREGMPEEAVSGEGESRQVFVTSGGPSSA